MRITTAQKLFVTHNTQLQTSVVALLCCAYFTPRYVRYARRGKDESVDHTRRCRAIAKCTRTETPYVRMHSISAVTYTSSANYSKHAEQSGITSILWMIRYRYTFLSWANPLAFGAPCLGNPREYSHKYDTFRKLIIPLHFRG